MAFIIFGKTINDRKPKTRVVGTKFILVDNGSVSGTTLTVDGSVQGSTLTV